MAGVYDAKGEGRKYGLKKDYKGLTKFINDNPSLTATEKEDLNAGYTAGVLESGGSGKSSSNSPQSPFEQLYSKFQGQSNITSLGADEKSYNFLGMPSGDELTGEILKQIQRESDLFVDFSVKDPFSEGNI